VLERKKRQRAGGKVAVFAILKQDAVYR